MPTPESRPGLLEGKQILVMGLLNTKSYAWTIGEAARGEGAEVIYTVQNKRFRDALLHRSFRQEGLEIDSFNILPCDVTSQDDIANLFSEIKSPLHGLVYSIGFANPATCLQESLIEAPEEDFVQALRISAIGLVSVARAAREKFIRGSSIIAMTFDSRKVYPHYGVMGVCKAALEAEGRYLARDLGPQGVRVNSLSAGPQRTMAAMHIPGFDSIGERWSDRSPLGWDLDEGRHLVAKSAVYLLSDLSGGVTGENLHVDGGFHSVALPINARAL